MGETVVSAGHREERKYRTRGAERQTVKDRKGGRQKGDGEERNTESDKLIKSGVLG